MKRINKKQLLNKFIFVGLIPIFLILFWLVASLFLNNKISFSVLLYKQPNQDIRQIPTGKLLKGDKITGQFQAQENYLGLVILRFNEYLKHDFNGEDILVFRLKEKDNKNWYFVGDYRSGLLENNSLFPFGFPVIDNSKSRTYQFEIDSLKGNQTNAVEVSKNNFDLLIGYQFPKKIILSTKQATIHFLLKKFITSFTNLDFLLSSTLYLFPFILYLLIYFISPWREIIKRLVFFITALVLFLIFSDIFILRETYLGLLVVLIIGWVYCIIKNKLDSRINFIFAAILILLWIILIQFKVNIFDNKINIWTYTFLVIGLIQSVLEEKKLITKNLK
jgi:hypothetical protein